MENVYHRSPLHDRNAATAQVSAELGFPGQVSVEDYKKT